MQDIVEKGKITIDKADHRPFTISSEESYYIGFLDFEPDSLGYHVQGEMNGLWFPPIRLVKNIYFSVDGVKVNARSAVIEPEERKFDFGQFTLNLRYDKNALYFEICCNDEIRIAANLDINVAPVWFSEKEPAKTIYRVGNSIQIAVDNYDSLFSITGSSGTSMEMAGSLLKISGNGKFEIRVVRTDQAGRGKTLPPGSDHCNEQMNSNEEGTILESGSENINNLLQWAKHNLKWLMIRTAITGRGLEAGHPEFPWYFGIDSFYSFKGMLLAGFHNDVRDTLSIISRLTEKHHGVVPHEIVTNGRIYHMGNVEEAAFFPTALLNYYDWTGDIEFVRQTASSALSAVELLLQNGIKGSGIMEDPSAGHGIDIDTACNYIIGLQSSSRLVDLIGSDTDRGFSQEEKRWRNFLERDMWMGEEGTYADRFTDGVPQFNRFWTVVIPYTFKLSDRNRYTRFVSGALNEISGKEGIVVDSSGNIMPLGTGLMVKAASNYSDRDNVVKFLDCNIRSFGKYSPGCFPEIVNNKDGCYLQAWSAAVFVENILEDIAGITPQENSVSFNPKPYSGDIIPEFSVRNLLYKGRTYEFQSG